VEILIAVFLKLLWEIAKTFSEEVGEKAITGMMADKFKEKIRECFSALRRAPKDKALTPQTAEAIIRECHASVGTGQSPWGG